MINDEDVAEILKEGIGDWVPIDRVVGQAREEARDFKTRTIQLIEYLLANNLMSVGDLGVDGFESWSGGVNEQIDRVTKGLDDFDWNPMGGFCWLANSAKGDEVGSRY
jgi:hypothetical protein